MERPAAPPRRLETAIVMSIVLHCCGLLVLAPLFARLRPWRDVTDEPRIRYVSLLTARARTPAPRISARPLIVTAVVPAVPKRAVPRPRPTPAAARTSAPPLHPTLLRRPAAAHAPTRLVAVGSRGTFERTALATAATTSATNRAPSAPPAPATPATPAASATVSAPSPAPAATATAPGAFGGLFSENYPPALPDPGIVAGIRGRLTGHGRIRISVDESGHASAITFVTGAPGADAESDVRAQLLGLTYVPADCSGLRCEGTLEITY